MQSKKFALSILLIVAIIIKTINIDPIINLICLFVSCFVISYNCFNNVNESIKYGIFLVIIFELLRILLTVNRHVFSEHLNAGEANDESTKGKDDKETNGGEDEETNGDEDDEETNEDEETNNGKNKTNKELEKLEEHLLNLDGKDEKHDKKLSIDDMSPAQAQRELYRLVDTTNLLKKTMTEMTPVLKEGKKIMKSIEALNMIQ
tara:strand:- start:55 stop:669 length:615 start_codon:yes stop_codon:yes gene_type:complete